MEKCFALGNKSAMIIYDEGVKENSFLTPFFLRLKV